jgi:carbon monoxide dehydrogenase subunit G
MMILKVTLGIVRARVDARVRLVSQNNNNNHKIKS